MFFGDTSKVLEEDEKEMTEVLFNSFGFFSDRYRRMNFSSESIISWVGLQDFQSGIEGPSLSNVDQIILAAEQIKMLRNQAEQSPSEAISHEDPDGPVISDILEHLKFYHPKNNSNKFQAHRKSSGGTTKAFPSKIELVKYLISDMDSKQIYPQDWRNHFIQIGDENWRSKARRNQEERKRRYLEEARQIGGQRQAEREDDDELQGLLDLEYVAEEEEVGESVQRRECAEERRGEGEGENENENSSTITEEVLQDMMSHLVYVHPNNDLTKYAIPLQPHWERYHEEADYFDSLDHLCLTIIRLLMKTQNDPQDWRLYYLSKDAE